MKSRLFIAAIFFFFLATSMGFAYTATFHPMLSVQGQYTDNIMLAPNGDLKEDDFITVVTPGFAGDLTGKKGEAKISYAPSYAFYNRFDEYNGWRHQASLSGNYMIGKNTRFNIGDKFLYTEDPIRYSNIAVIRTEEPTTPIDTTERKTRKIYITNFASVGLDHQFGKYDSFRLGYSYNLLNNDDPIYEDKQSHNASIGLTHWFGPKWGFDVGGNYLRGEYEVSDNLRVYQGAVKLLRRFGKQFVGYISYSHSVATYDGRSGNDTTYVPTLGFKYDIEKDISLIADAGFFYTDSDFRDNTSNATGDIRLIKLFEHGKLNVALLGGYAYDVYGAETLGYGVYYEASFSLIRQLAKHVDGNIFGFWRHTDYKDVNRTDKRPTIGLGLSWQALQWMKLELDYRFQSVDSTIDSFDYDENRVFVGVTVTTKQPFHTSRY